MTDLEAIKQYRDAMAWWETLFYHKQPRIFQDSPEIMAQLEARRQRRMRKVERDLHQAEDAIARLPRFEWRAAIVQRYILQRDHLAAAEAMCYSESSVRRFEAMAVKFLEAGEAEKTLLTALAGNLPKDAAGGR